MTLKTKLLVIFRGIMNLCCIVGRTYTMSRNSPLFFSRKLTFQSRKFSFQSTLHTNFLKSAGIILVFLNIIYNVSHRILTLLTSLDPSDLC